MGQTRQVLGEHLARCEGIDSLVRSLPVNDSLATKVMHESVRKRAATCGMPISGHTDSGTKKGRLVTT